MNLSFFESVPKMEGLIFSSSTAAVCVATVIVVLIPIWALKMLNSLWLRPKRFERLLRAQGLHGDPYSLSNQNSNQTQIQQHDLNSQAFGVSDDVVPRVSSSVYHTITKYGKNSFLWEGTTPKVIIADPKQIKEVFDNMHDFQKPKLSGNAKFLMSGLLSYEGEKWAKHRRIINPAFYLEKLKNMLPAFSQSCHDMISTWKEMLSPDGTCEIDVWPFLQNLSCDVISRTAFGSSYAEGTKIFQLLRMQGYLLMTAQYKNIPIFRYPRTPSVRKGWVFRQLVKLIIFTGVMGFIIEQYMNPIVQNSHHPLKGNLLYAIERILKLSVPNVYVWLCMFYCFFHLWLNILAELIRFGDREFYKDWWNAKTVEEYWRMWNMPVHKWMVRHIYFPCLRYGIPKGASALIAFLVSAVFHELCIAVPCHMFKLWAFIGIMFQVPLVLITNYLQNKYRNSMVGNMIFWFIFCILGQPMCVLLYYHDLMNRKGEVD